MTLKLDWVVSFAELLAFVLFKIAFNEGNAYYPLHLLYADDKWAGDELQETFWKH